MWGGPDDSHGHSDDMWSCGGDKDAVGEPGLLSSYGIAYLSWARSDLDSQVKGRLGIVTSGVTAEDGKAEEGPACLESLNQQLASVSSVHAALVRNFPNANVIVALETLAEDITWQLSLAKTATSYSKLRRTGSGEAAKVACITELAAIAASTDEEHVVGMRAENCKSCRAVCCSHYRQAAFYGCR